MIFDSGKINFKNEVGIFIIDFLMKNRENYGMAKKEFLYVKEMVKNFEKL